MATTIKIRPNTPLAEVLIKMAEHKKLRHQFRRGEISLDELNNLLSEKGINKHYEHPAVV